MVNDTSARHGSIYVLEHILTHEKCDVDPINDIEKATPLHLAVQLEPAKLRHHFVESLLEAGADTKFVCSFISTFSCCPNSLFTKSFKDKNGDKAEDLIPSGDQVLRDIFRKNQMQASFSRDDIANGKCPWYRSTRLHKHITDSDVESGSGSDEV